MRKFTQVIYAFKLKASRELVEQTSVDCMLPAELVAGVDGHPTLRGYEVQHLYFADVRGAAELIQVAIFDYKEPGSTGAVVKGRQHSPLVSGYIIHFACSGAVVSVPRADHDDVAIEPRGDSVGVTLVVHICQPVELHCSFVEHTCLL